MGNAASPEAILASSTSAILPSTFTGECTGRERTIVVHPINPPFLVPACEVVPAPWTSQKTIDATMELIEQNDYGYCEACGVEIGIQRLEARPTATQCIDCKTLAEIKEKQEMG